jgi:hypothetical protein
MSYQPQTPSLLRTGIGSISDLLLVPARATCCHGTWRGEHGTWVESTPPDPSPPPPHTHRQTPAVVQHVVHAHTHSTQSSSIPVQPVADPHAVRHLQVHTGVCLTASRCPLHPPCPFQGPVTVKHHGQQLKVDLVASHVAAGAGRLLAGEVGLVVGCTAVHQAPAAVASSHMPCIPSGFIAIHLFVGTPVCETGPNLGTVVPQTPQSGGSFAIRQAGHGAVSNQLDRSQSR